MVGTGAPWLWRCLPWVTPQPEASGKEPRLTSAGALDPGGPPPRWDGGQEAPSPRAPGPPSPGRATGLCPVCSGWGWATLGWAAQRRCEARGAALLLMLGRAAPLGRRRREEEGLNRGLCGPGWTLPISSPAGWGGTSASWPRTYCKVLGNRGWTKKKVNSVEQKEGFGKLL